ncbi:DUF262 domain-containing protein [Eilatimonas milleporae]|uniref:Uncharacterized protein with ParB-like and HNH nuclease domain n=1 Tax=Eilatimonas milleporae TaxID=911205 RepID=A0A3M0BZZ3_9PROT|nr:DUF262 domain-containing protein [Eilatimonas milleporae]RMB01947.1 uncharacterized protein with ParB-like and HNH nuclease domain [Eilatimonas milleporae]
MTIETAHQSITVLFEQNQTFEVPKYQREYAWDADAIEDFVEDLGKCLEARLQNGKRNHFFGGIVSARLNVPGSSRPSYEVIDGQQRISSLVMLAAAVVFAMKAISANIEVEEEPSEEDGKALDYLKQTIAKIESLFLTHRYAVGLEYKVVPKLTLSKADNVFFQAILAGNNPPTERPSHDRIKYAWQRLNSFLASALGAEETASSKATKLQHLIDHVLAEDCTVIFMWSDNRSEAYRIFQVLNDRGVSLTNGDLLRARTLELLDHKAVETTQNELAERWDSTLAYPPSSIDDYLLWYFGSYQGVRPRQSDVTDSFMEVRFAEASLDKPITQSQATKILAEVKRLDDDFALLNQLNSGEWPYADQTGVKQWDVERLNLLVSHLKHTNAMPLLMALRLLEPKRFAEAVASLERFVFRYKTIGSAHISPATKLYHEQALLVRNDPSTYKVGVLRTALGELIEKYASGNRFSAAISELTYSPRGGNGHIRYLLTALEDYAKWYESGANGVPKCKDKTRVFDFSNTTLEHVYPRSAKGAEKIEDLEKVKHALGNLTIFGPNDNDAAANKSFADKRTILQASNLKLNRDIGAHADWTAERIKQRTQSLVDMALKVFVP